MQYRHGRARPTARGRWTRPTVIATAAVAALSLGAVSLSGGLQSASAAEGHASEARASLVYGSVLEPPQKGDLGPESFTVRDLSLSVALTPAYASTSAVPNVPATSEAPTFTDANGEPATAPAGTKYVLGPDAPTRAGVDPDTGEVTWTPADSDAGSNETIPVVVSYPDGTSEAVEVPFVVGELSEAYDPAFATTAAVPSVEVTSEEPTFTDGSGTLVATPADAVFALGAGAPAGAEIDAETGVITWTPGTGVANSVVNIPVVVTYSDGSSDAAQAPFTVGSVADLTPAYSPTLAQPNVEAASQEASFTDTTGADVDAPEGTVFALGAGAPAGAEIDAETGVITWTPGAGVANSVVNIPVVVTYPDGSSDDATAAFNVGDVLDADAYIPAYEPTQAVPGMSVTSEVPTFTDAGGASVSAPAGTTFAKGATAPADAQVNETTGTVTWTPSLDDASETIDIPVMVTYPDDTTDDAVAPFQVGPLTDALTPAYASTSAVPNVPATSEAPTFTDANGESTTAPEGTAFELGVGAPEGAEIDDATGAITWTPELADSGTTVPIPVVVTYSDGSTDEAEAPFDVQVSNADASAPEAATANGSGDTDGGSLPETGTSLNMAATVGAILLALAGAGVFVASRRVR